MKKKILAIAGSIRKASINKAVLKHIANTFGEEIDIEIYKQVGQLPIFNPDLEGDQLPEIIKVLQAKIKAADGIIISTPEYVFSLPGNLKNLLEWNVATTLFSQKPVALIVAAASGEKALESLSLVMSTITVTTIPENLKLHLKGIGSKINADGVLTDALIAIKIKELVKTLCQKIEEPSE